MINIGLKDNGELFEVNVSGHAGYKEKGLKSEYDLVCCAVSVLIQNWELSTKTICPGVMDITENENPGEYSARVKKTRDSEVLFRSLLLGLKRLSDEYKSNIRITMEAYNGS